MGGWEGGRGFGLDGRGGMSGVVVAVYRVCRV